MTNNRSILDGNGNEVKLELYSVGEQAVVMVTGVGQGSYTANTPLVYTPKDEEGEPLDFDLDLARGFKPLTPSRVSILMTDPEATCWLNRQTQGRKDLSDAVRRSLEP